MLFAAYEHHGVLLSQAELQVVGTNTAVLPENIRLFIEKSRKSLDEDLELNIATLAEAEDARDRAVRHKQIAEQREQELAALNAELEAKNVLTQAQLDQEKELRAQQNRFGIQRQLSLMLGGLVLIGLVLPYMAQLFYSVDQNTANQTGNIVLLLVNGLMIVVGSLFNRRQDEDKDENRA